MADNRAAERALTALGAATAGVLAFKALRAAAWWSWLRFGPVVAHQYKGQFALISGGSEGIGLGVADALAGYGINVALVSRSPEKLARAKAYLTGRHAGVEVVTVAADLTADGATAKVVSALAAAGVKDRVGILVCNAGGGIARMVPYQAFTDAEVDTVRRLNGDATYGLVRAFLPQMAAAGRGHVVLISSLITRMPHAMLSTYYLEKAKVNALATVLQAEQDALGSGVTVQAFTLGAVLTPAFASFVAPAAAAAAPKDSIGWELGAVGFKPNFLVPSAQTVGEWVVRAMGKGLSPVLSPHPGHALSVAMREPALWVSWPGCLRRAVARRLGMTVRGGGDEKAAE